MTHILMQLDSSDQNVSVCNQVTLRRREVDFAQ